MERNLTMNANCLFFCLFSGYFLGRYRFFLSRQSCVERTLERGQLKWSTLKLNLMERNLTMNANCLFFCLFSGYFLGCYRFFLSRFFFSWTLSWTSACLRGRVRVFLPEFFFRVDAFVYQCVFSWKSSFLRGRVRVCVDACMFTFLFIFIFSFINSQPLDWA